MRKLLVIVGMLLLYFGCLGFADGITKQYDNFNQFYEDLAKYKNIYKYCYIDTNNIPPGGMDVWWSAKQDVAATDKSITTEHSFVYAKAKSGEIFVFTFTNTLWGNQKMFYIDPKSYHNKSETYDEAINTFKMLVK